MTVNDLDRRVTTTMRSDRGRRDPSARFRAMAGTEIRHVVLPIAGLGVR